MFLTELLVRTFVGLILTLFCLVDLETINGFMLSRPHIMPGVYGAVRESQNERTRKTLKFSTCSHWWWETLKGCIFDVKLSTPALRGLGVVWW